MSSYAVPFPGQGPQQPQGQPIAYQYAQPGMPDQQFRQQQYVAAGYQPQPGYPQGQMATTYQQPHVSQNQAYVQPGTVAYTATQAPNGGIVYQPVVAREVSIQTPQGLVKSIQYVPVSANGSPHQGTTPQGSAAAAPAMYPAQTGAASYGVQTSHMGVPTQAHAPPPSAMGHVPGVAYDMRTYGDAFSGIPSTKEMNKERKRREKEMEREEKERRKAIEKAEKKQREWAKADRERYKADDDELRRARDRDRERDRDDNYGPRIRGASMSAPISGMPTAPGMASGGWDPTLESRMGGLGIGGDRERKMSTVGRSHSRHASTTDLTYGGNAYGAPFNGPISSGYSPSGADVSYTRERKVSQMSQHAPPVATYVSAPGGGIMPVPERGAGANTPYGGSNRSNRSYPSSPARVPISQMPTSPGPPQPTYGGHSPYSRGGGIGGSMGAPGNSNMSNMGGMGGMGGMNGMNGMGGGGMGSMSGVGGMGGVGGVGKMGSMVPGASIGTSSSPVPGYPSAGANYSQAHAFGREPSRQVAYSPFEPFAIVMDMDELLEMLPKVPPLPLALVSHDVLHEDWARYMSDVVAAWQPQAHTVSAGQRARMVRPLIEMWNRQFFFNRAVQFRFGKVHRPQRRGSRYGDDDDDAYSEDDSESESSQSDDDGDEYGDDPYRRKNIRRSRRRPDETIYNLVVEYVPPAPMPSRKPAVGYPGVGFP